MGRSAAHRRRPGTPAGASRGGSHGGGGGWIAPEPTSTQERAGPENEEEPHGQEGTGPTEKTETVGDKPCQPCTEP